MEISLNHLKDISTSQELVIVAAYSQTLTEKKKGNKTEVATAPKVQLVKGHWPLSFNQTFDKTNASKHFKGQSGEIYTFTTPDGRKVMAVGMGEKNKLTLETLRRELSKAYLSARMFHAEISILIDSFTVKNNLESTVYSVAEALNMAHYVFDKHMSKKTPMAIKHVYLDTNAPKGKLKKGEALLKQAKIVADSVNLCRDLVNEPPNILHSEEFATRVELDAKTLPRVKVKVLDKAQIKKEKMGLFLSVNAGSNYEARLVHLTYTPKKSNSKTKHVALVGKGLTFDTGGYSLKPGAGMINMKFDMAGAATVYSAFRAAVLTDAPIKISCFLGMTDNAVSSTATMPDSICKARNGKTVEILNTDAEGRLVLADVLDYACEQGASEVIDAATLTGAVLVALGQEVCGLMGNDDKLKSALLKSAKAVDEYMWELPIIEEFRKDLKSPSADLANIPSNRNAGSAKAAAFLENFVRPGVKWAHLDIAGIGDGQNHLPYCPPKGSSGLIVRTLFNYLSS